jgi:hypothetical protein
VGDDGAYRDGLFLFTFQVSTRESQIPSFGCVADSPESALQIAHDAGHTSALLVDQRSLQGTEKISNAMVEALANPLIGPTWAPLTLEMNRLHRGMHPGTRNRDAQAKAGRFWQFDVLDDPGAKDPDAKLYAQAMTEADGSLHLEVGPTTALNSGDHAVAIMEFLGWRVPQEDLPNYWCVLEPGWNHVWATSLALQTLVLVGGMTDGAVFAIEGMNSQTINASDHFENVTFERDGLTYRGFRLRSVLQLVSEEETKRLVSHLYAGETLPTFPGFDNASPEKARELRSLWETHDTLVERGGVTYRSVPFRLWQQEPLLSHLRGGSDYGYDSCNFFVKDPGVTPERIGRIVFLTPLASGEWAENPPSFRVRIFPGYQHPESVGGWIKSIAQWDRSTFDGHAGSHANRALVPLDLYTTEGSGPFPELGPLR